MAETGDHAPRWSRSSASAPGPASWTARGPSPTTGGDLDKAIALLREQGGAAAAKKAGRDAREGQVFAYIHAGGRVGVLIEVNTETDFVARNDDFQKLCRDLAMQIAGLAPEFVTIESIPADVLERKRAELVADEDVQKKPDDIRAKIVDGQLKKWYQQVVLYEQPFRDTDRPSAS